MLKSISLPFQIIFDIETVPDLETARRVYPELDTLANIMKADCYTKAALSPGKGKKKQAEGIEFTDQEIDQPVLDGLYKIAGATEENPRPFLKFLLHKVVSIVGISRKQVPISEECPFGIELRMFSMPSDHLDTG